MGTGGETVTVFGAAALKCAVKNQLSDAGDTLGSPASSGWDDSDYWYNHYRRDGGIGGY